MTLELMMVGRQCGQSSFDSQHATQGGTRGRVEWRVAMGDGEVGVEVGNGAGDGFGRGIGVGWSGEVGGLVGVDGVGICWARGSIVWAFRRIRLFQILPMDELLKNQVFATHALAAAGSVALGTALTYPLDTVKVLIQVGSASNKQLTAAQVLDRVKKLSGNSGLYSGFGWLTMGRIFGFGARFGTYEILTAFYKDGREDNQVHVFEALMAGIAAGAVESLISSPFKLIKLRAQVSSASRIPTPTAVTERIAFACKIAARILTRYEGFEPFCWAFVHSNNQTS
ncbi:hypothetical protein Vadar_031312 [Vaccinium darrowii]|uniref:Uncharacterized protein n=1 Tax=Vaccinium darrowii TaxID=229202 RepID=A0ACB7XW41_9ERIC|nr:hypothetical protein Vadar_031312 [Vaccinium darrowii]